jgi:hypothetical protein
MLNKLFSTAVGLILLGVACLVLTHAESGEAEGVPILAFKTMVPVTGPFVGMANPIRTVPEVCREKLRMVVATSWPAAD